MGIFMEDTELIKASKIGDADLVQKLLASGANIKDRDERGHTPLHLAAESGYLEVVKILVEKGADVNAPQLISGEAIWGWTPVSAAASRGHLEVTTYLSEKGGKLYKRGGPLDYFSVMNGAAASGNLELVKFLHEEKNLPINEPHPMHEVTPLHMAIEKAHEHIVSYLIDQGANPKAKGKIQKSPLECVKNKLNSESCSHSMKQKLQNIITLMEQPDQSSRHPSQIPSTSATPSSKKKWWQFWK
jgi:ankyrin repeat protein